MEYWKKNFFIIWQGQAVSQLSSSVIQFALVWHLTNKTGSAMVLSAAMFMSFFPQGILGPFVGVFVDRYDRKKIMICADLFIAVVTAVLIVYGFFEELPIWLILLVLFLRSIGAAFHQSALLAVTPQIVPKEELARCAGYSQSLQSISQILSPAVAAVLYSAWSLNLIMLVDVLGALIAVFTLCLSHIPQHIQHPISAEKPLILKDVVEGFCILRSHKGVLGVVLISSLYSLALMPTSAIFPLMSIAYFGGTSTHASIVEVVFSTGLLAGSIILGIWGGTRNKIYTIVGSFLLMSLSLFLSGLLPTTGFTAFVVLAGMMGVSGPFFWGMYNPILQQSFDDKYMGRVMSLSRSIIVLSGYLGLAVVGVFAEKFGVEKWFLVAGSLTLFAAILFMCIPVVRHCDDISDNRVMGKINDRSDTID